MARLQISLPTEFNFSTEIPIRMSDINRGSHLGHVAMLAIIEEARTRFLTSLGFDLDGGLNQGTGYLVMDVAIIYKKQAYYGQTLKIEIAAVDFQEKSFDFLYKITETASGVEIARAKTGHLLFNFQMQKIVPITPDFRQKFVIKE
jgi:acyl-CoA thioester hydrolase